MYIHTYAHTDWKIFNNPKNKKKEIKTNKFINVNIINIYYNKTHWLSICKYLDFQLIANNCNM